MQLQVSISKIVDEVIGELVPIGTFKPSDFTRQDFDINTEAQDAQLDQTLSHQPRECNEESQTVVAVGNCQYQCTRVVGAKTLQFGRNDENDFVPLEKTFPRFAMRVCLYTETDAAGTIADAAGNVKYQVKVKAAGYGSDGNGGMVMKLTDKATPLNGGSDFSTSNPVYMFTGMAPGKGDDIRSRHRSIVSIKGDVYSMQYPHPRRAYANVIDAASPVAGYQCGDIYVRIQVV